MKKELLLVVGSFFMLFFIGMGLGMNIEIAIVLFYGCSDSGSHKEYDCINRFDDV